MLHGAVYDEDVVSLDFHIGCPLLKIQVFLFDRLLDIIDEFLKFFCLLMG